MAPVPLQPHSCYHCQRLVVKTRDRPQYNGDAGEEKNFEYFQYNIPNILVAAGDNCRFFQWLLDEEWIHRSVVVDKVYSESNLPEDDIFRSVLDAVAEASIRINEQLPPPNPGNTLRRFAEEHKGGQLNGLRLACFLYSKLYIRFFGLWDPIVKHMVYRTRHGFNVFTPSGRSTFLIMLGLFYLVP